MIDPDVAIFCCFLSSRRLGCSNLGEPCLSPLETEQLPKKFRPIDENETLNGPIQAKSLDTDDHRLSGDSALNSRALLTPALVQAVGVVSSSIRGGTELGGTYQQGGQIPF